MTISLDPRFFIALAAAGVLGCRPAPPKLGMPAPGEPGSTGDDRALAEVPYESGALPEVPGLASPKAGVPQARRSPPALDDGTPRAPTTVALALGDRLGHDPGVAVGDRFMVVYTAHRYQLFDKATVDVAVPDLDDEVPVAGDFNTLFSPLWAPRDKHGAPNLQSINRRLRFTAGDPLACDPLDPLGKASPACVREFYDSRVQWDPIRRRFWIESAVRNHLWFCPPARPCDNPKWSPTQPRRFIAIAVSRTEDPRQGFHRYVLVDEYADWPKMTVANGYLVLGHMSSPYLYVFDADKLAAGNPDHGPVRLAKLDGTSFPGAKFLNPVTQHGPRSDVSLVVATDGSEYLTMYGLLNVDPARAAPPVVVAASRVKIGVPLGGFSNNAIYEDGKLYLAWSDCTPGHDACLRRVHVLRLPVAWGPGRTALVASTDPAQGYLHATFTGAEADDAPGDEVDATMPVLDVTAAGDVVIGYARHGARTRAPIPYEVRYRILYHGETAPRPSVLVRRGSSADVPDIEDNGKAGIDLPGAQTDPDGRTVWISHAVSDGVLRWYRQVTFAVRP